HSQGHGQPYKPRVVPVKDMSQSADPGGGDLDKLRGRRRDMGGKGEEGGEDGDLDDASADAQQAGNESDPEAGRNRQRQVEPVAVAIAGRVGEGTRDGNSCREANRN